MAASFQPYEALAREEEGHNQIVGEMACSNLWQLEGRLCLRRTLCQRQRVSPPRFVNNLVEQKQP